MVNTQKCWWDLSTILQHVSLPSQNHSLKYHIIQIVEVCKFHICVVKYYLPIKHFLESMHIHHVWLSYDMVRVRVSCIKITSSDIQSFQPKSICLILILCGQPSIGCYCFQYEQIMSCKNSSLIT